MERQVIGRRAILRTVGVAAGGVVLTSTAIAATAHADNDNDDDDDNDHDDNNGHRRKITGSWMVTALGGGDTTILVASFAGGGVAISHEINPAGPPFTGTWAQKGQGFRATLWSGFPGEGPGAPGPTAKLHIEGNLQGDGTIAGTFTVSIIDPPTGNTVDSFSGTFTGVRIRASD